MTQSDWNRKIDRHLSDSDYSFLSSLADWAKEVKHPLSAAYRLLAEADWCPLHVGWRDDATGADCGGYCWLDDSTVVPEYRAAMKEKNIGTRHVLPPRVFARLDGEMRRGAPDNYLRSVVYPSFGAAAAALRRAFFQCIGPLPTEGGAL